VLSVNSNYTQSSASTTTAERIAPDLYSRRLNGKCFVVNITGFPKDIKHAD
jgi:hypothetical protein